MNISERTGYHPINQPPEDPRVTAARLNPIYAVPGYHKYPQPDIKRYLGRDNPLDNSVVSIDISQLREDYGSTVAHGVMSAAEIFFEITNMETPGGKLSEADQLLTNGLLNAKRAYLRDLSNSLTHYLDVDTLLQTFYDINIPEFDSIGNEYE